MDDDRISDLLRRIDELNAIGIALSAETDTQRLLELILLEAKKLTGADGGTLYAVTEDRQVNFEIVRTDSLAIALGGTGGASMTFPPIALYDADGRPNETMVVAQAVLKRQTIHVADAYAEQGYDFSGTRAFDRHTGYHSRSFLTVPMQNHENQVIGVLQLINKIDPATGRIMDFSPADQQFAESLASQAAVTLTKKRLIDELHTLFESFIKLIASAIDAKSPYTGGHCRRVPVLTMLLADATCAAEEGDLRDFKLTDQQRYELQVAAWLHDCGKITTPEYVIDKATKLQTIHDRIDLVNTRFEVLRRDLEIELLRTYP